MPTTTNFGWTTPADTDLVKDGALAIRTLGNGVDTSLVDLKGGTTGQALTKATNTDLDYSWTDVISASNAFLAGKNKILNGDFRINQRAFTSNTANDSFNFDRWFQQNSGGTVTVTPQTFTPGTAPVAGYEAINFVRIDVTGQSAASNFASLHQKIEDARTFANQTATISFWAKAASGTPNVSLELVQNFGTGGSPSATVNTYAGKVTLSTVWNRYSIVVSVPTVSGQTFGTTANTSWLGIRLFVSAGSDFNARTGTLGTQTNTFDFWGVQAEAGSVATAFQTATGTLAGELAACQRYYEKSYPQASAPGSVTNAGIVTSTVTSATNGALWTFVPFKVNKRGTPTITIYGYNGGSGKVSAESTGNDQAAGSGAAKVIGEYGFTAYNNSGGTVSPAGGTAFHFEASAEL